MTPEEEKAFFEFLASDEYTFERNVAKTSDLDKPGVLNDVIQDLSRSAFMAGYEAGRKQGQEDNY